MAKSIPIKICGITRLEDAQLALDLGALALGFIFFEKSPRYVSPEKVRDILARVRCEREFLKVGVFVDADADRLKRYHDISGIDILQLHGNESPEFVASLKDYRKWKAFRLEREDQFQELAAYQASVEAFLFDAAVPGQFGGTGHRLSDDLLSKIPRQHPFLLAGGLNPSNAENVYKTYQPYALDLSSGVESSPGVKDPLKLQKLFQGRV